MREEEKRKRKYGNTQDLLNNIDLLIGGAGFEEEEKWFETWAQDYRGRGGEDVTVGEHEVPRSLGNEEMQRAQMGDQSKGGVGEQLSSRSLGSDEL